MRAGAVVRADGRVVTRVRLPVGLIERAEIDARRHGRPVPDYLGDVVAEALPQVLADAARAKLERMAALAAERGADLTLNAATPPELPPTALPSNLLTSPHVVISVPGPGTEPEPGRATD